MFDLSLVRLIGLADISITPDFNGLPPSVMAALIHLTNNLAALLLLVSGLGIVISLLGLVAGSWVRSPQLRDRSLSGLFVASSAGGLLFVSQYAANYFTHLAR